MALCPFVPMSLWPFVPVFLREKTLSTGVQGQGDEDVRRGNAYFTS